MKGIPFFYNPKMLMSYHVLLDLQDKLRKEALKDSSSNAPLWCMCKDLFGVEHAQWIYECYFPKEVRGHSIFGIKIK